MTSMLEVKGETVPNYLLALDISLHNQFPNFNVRYEESLEERADALLRNLESQRFDIPRECNYFLLNRTYLSYNLAADPFASKLFSANADGYCIVETERNVLIFVSYSEEPLDPLYVVLSSRKLFGYGKLSNSELLRDMAMNAAIALNDNLRYYDKKAYYILTLPGSGMLENLLNLLNYNEECIEALKSCDILGMSQYENYFVLILDKTSPDWNKHYKTYLDTFKGFYSNIEYDQILERYAETYFESLKRKRYNLPLMVDFFVCRSADTQKELKDAIFAQKMGCSILERICEYKLFGAANIDNQIVFAFLRSFEGLPSYGFFQNFRRVTKGDYLENKVPLNIKAREIAIKLYEGTEITEEINYIYFKSAIEPTDYIQERRIFGLFLYDEDNFDKFMKYGEFGFGACSDVFVITLENEIISSQSSANAYEWQQN